MKKSLDLAYSGFSLQETFGCLDFAFENISTIYQRLWGERNLIKAYKFGTLGQQQISTKATLRNLLLKGTKSKYFRFYCPILPLEQESRKQSPMTCKWMGLAVSQWNFIYENRWWAGFDLHATVYWTRVQDLSFLSTLGLNLADLFGASCIRNIPL